MVRLSERELIKRRLLKTRDHILRYPERYDQQSLGYRSVGCIACHLDAVVTPLKLRRKAPENNFNRALIAIGLDPADPWPWLFTAFFREHMDLAEQYAQAITAKGRAAVGAAAIDRYIEERGL